MLLRFGLLLDLLQILFCSSSQDQFSVRIINRRGEMVEQNGPDNAVHLFPASGTRKSPGAQDVHRHVFHYEFHLRRSSV